MSLPEPSCKCWERRKCSEKYRHHRRSGRPHRHIYFQQQKRPENKPITFALYQYRYQRWFVIVRCSIPPAQTLPIKNGISEHVPISHFMLFSYFPVFPAWLSGCCAVLYLHYADANIHPYPAESGGAPASLPAPISYFKLMLNVRLNN